MRVDGGVDQVTAFNKSRAIWFWRHFHRRCLGRTPFVVGAMTTRFGCAVVHLRLPEALRGSDADNEEGYVLLPAAAKNANVDETTLRRQLYHAFSSTADDDDAADAAYERCFFPVNGIRAVNSLRRALINRELHEEAALLTQNSTRATLVRVDALALVVSDADESEIRRMRAARPHLLAHMLAGPQ